MTTTLRIGFPWGRYHGTPWGRHPNEASVDWPPSPWRLLRALYSVWKTRCPDLDEAVVTRTLAKLAVPPTYRCPSGRYGHTRHWMPTGDHTVIRYGKDLALDAFIALPRDEPLWIQWPVLLDTDEREALRRLTESMSYLGRAESICEAVLDDGRPSAHPDYEWVPVHETGEPDGGDRLELLSPAKPLDLEALVAEPREIRDQRRVQPERTTFVPYILKSSAKPRGAATARRSRRTAQAVRFHLDAPAPPTAQHALTVAHLVRLAAMSQFDGQSAIFSGRSENGMRRDDHAHAHFIAFSCRQAERPAPVPVHSAPIDTVIIWAPEGLDADHLAALSRVRFLRPPDHVRGVPRSRLGLEVIGDVGSAAPELCSASNLWTSLTPFLPARHPRKRPFDDHTRDMVRAELRWRGLPDPAEVEVIPDPSWRRFRRHRPGTSLRTARPGRYVRVRFDDSVEGPLALGALSHFGLGLFVPVSEP